jgi:AmmeMemoRadiSam system protein B
LPVDTTLARRLVELVPGLVPDTAAHRGEHCLEVLLPFLLHLYGPSIAILPLVMADQSLATSQLLGEALASIVGAGGILVLASSDFSHYLTDASARREDSYALQAIQSLDAAALARVMRERGLNMCGPGPILALLVAFRILGATSARLLAYATSGDTSGDRTSVVGYAAVEVGAGRRSQPDGTSAP